MRLVLAVQSHAQLLQTYSEHAARAIMSCCSTAFLLQCAAGAAADQQFCAELVGRRQVLRRSTSASSTESESSSQPRKSKTSSESWAQAEELLIPPPAFRSAIGVTQHGVTGFLLTPAAVAIDPKDGHRDPLVILCRWPFAPRPEESDEELQELPSIRRLSRTAPFAAQPAAENAEPAAMYDDEMKAALAAIERLAGQQPHV